MKPFHHLKDSCLVLSPKKWNGIIYSYHLFVFFLILIPITMNYHYSVPNVLWKLESSILMWWTLGAFGNFYMTPCSQINQMSIWFIFSFSPSFYWPLIFFCFFLFFVGCVKICWFSYVDLVSLFYFWHPHMPIKKEKKRPKFLLWHPHKSPSQINIT